MAKKTVEVPETTGDDTPTADTPTTLAEEVGAGGGAGSVGGGDPGETAAEIPAAIDEGVKPAQPAAPAAVVPASPEQIAATFEPAVAAARAKLEALERELIEMPDPFAESKRLGKIYQEKHAAAQARKNEVEKEVQEALSAAKAEERRQGDKVAAKNKLQNAVDRARRDLALVEEQQRVAVVMAGKK